MTFEKLKKNIIDVIEEEQIKLGFQEETIRLYYPLQSLNLFLETEYSVEEMHKALEEFTRQEKERLGRIEISEKGERFCIKLPKETAIYVHEKIPKNEFLCDFIALISQHETKIEDILACFQNYSDKLHFEKVQNGEFDYLIYFEDGIPDDYRYCITDEGVHMIYHRYTKEDYKELGL